MVSTSGQLLNTIRNCAQMFLNRDLPDLLIVRVDIARIRIERYLRINDYMFILWQVDDCIRAFSYLIGLKADFLFKINAISQTRTLQDIRKHQLAPMPLHF